jgi:hypothetical protein
MNNNNKQIHINVSYNGNTYPFSINNTMPASDFKQMIFKHFQINSLTYTLLFKTYKFPQDDTRPLSSIILKEKYPLLFLMKKSALQKLETKQQPKSHLTIRSKMPENKFLKLLTEYFKSKYLPFNAQINNQTHGIYEVIFQNETLAHDFQTFFNHKASDDKTMDPLPILHQSPSTGNFIAISKRKKRYQQIENKLLRNASCRYMNYEEKRRHEAFLDKQNWINKEGFIVSVGKYSMKIKDISNYVGMTPSEPPVNYKYRIVNKKKWITPKGFC